MKRWTVVLVLLLALSGCAAQQSPASPTTAPASSSEGASLDLAGLIDALHAAGAEVKQGNTLQQPYFSVEGQVITVDSANVQVYEYPTAAAMTAEAEQVMPDGSSIGTNMVSWMATPHFYKAGRVLAIYLGDDRATLDLLQGVLGQQFAGG